MFEILLKWDSISFEGDMAILELETPIEEWSDFIMPACIHQNGLGLFSNLRYNIVVDLSLASKLTDTTLLAERLS